MAIDERLTKGTMMFEFLTMADYAMKKYSFNAAVILYQRVLDMLADLHLKDTGASRENRHDKFQAIKHYCPDLAPIFARTYNIYRRSYNELIPEETADSLKNTVHDLINQSQHLLKEKPVTEGDGLEIII